MKNKTCSMTPIICGKSRTYTPSDATNHEIPQHNKNSGTNINGRQMIVKLNSCITKPTPAKSITTETKPKKIAEKTIETGNISKGKTTFLT